MGHRPSTRRNFLLASLAATAGAVGCAAARQPQQPVGLASNSTQAVFPEPNVQPTAQRLVSLTSSPLPKRPFGRLGDPLPLLGLGGSASPLSRSHQEREAIAIVERALELGVRYFDTAANYGPSEDFLGQVLPAYRSEVFIATKTAYRDRDQAWRQLERSLKRLNTDYIDLWQFHSLAYDWDIDTILDRQQGAILAAEEAQAQGVIRGVGITGHHEPAVIIKGLQHYPFDAALIPINAADKHTQNPFTTNVLPVAQQNNTAIIAMKVPAYGRLLKPGVLAGMHEAMGYALSQPGVSCCIIAADTLPQLEENVQAAAQFQQLSAQALTEIETRTAQVWQENSFFRRWT